MTSQVAPLPLRNASGSREEALKLIDSLLGFVGSSAKKISQANEAETRLLVVDNVLRALGWSDQDFKPETALKSGEYTDYLLTVDSVPRLIVEVKRVGHTFIRRRGELRKSVYLLSYIQGAFDSAFLEVVEQARGYAENTGVPFALLTNGVEWVLVQLLAPPGSNPSDRRCIFFGNLLNAERNFELLWNTVSRTSVVGGALEEELGNLNSIEAEFLGNRPALDPCYACG